MSLEKREEHSIGFKCFNRKTIVKAKCFIVTRDPVKNRKCPLECLRSGDKICSLVSARILLCMIDPIIMRMELNDPIFTFGKSIVFLLPIV